MIYTATFLRIPIYIWGPFVISIHKKHNITTKKITTMGGLAGHMMHPHDNMNLTIGSFKRMIKDSVEGRKEFKEKLDGYNIHVLKYRDQLRFARNGKDLLHGGFGLEEMDNKFSSDEIRSKFKDAYKYLAASLNIYEMMNFEATGITYNCEILCGTTNIIPYYKSTVICHNIYKWEYIEQEYEGKFEVVNITDAQACSEPLLARFKVGNKLYYKQTADVQLIEQQLNKIFVGLSDEQTLKNYYQLRFIGWMSINYPQLIQNTQLIGALFNRFFKVDKQTNLREIRKMTTWDLDPMLDIAKEIRYECVRSLDLFILEVGTRILRDVHGYSNEQNKYSCCSQLQANIILTSPTDKFMERWGACDNEIFALEGVVFEHEGDLYKWTGPFAPINQLIGGSR